jgi:hypothetical protein
MKKSTLLKVREVWQRWLYVTGCLLFLLIGQSSFAQTITLGSGTATSVDNTTGNGLGPVNGYYAYMRYQVVYTAAEIIAAGGSAGGNNITQFGWNVAAVPGGSTLPNYRVRMANTTATNSASHNTATLTEVYNSSFSPTTGFNMFTLSTPFIWDGVSNLLVDVCYGPVPFTSPYGTVYVYGTDANSSRLVRSDGSSRCGTNTDRVNAFKPQARMVLQAPPSCLTPSSLQAASVTTVSATVNWTASSSNPSGGYDYYMSQTNNAPDGATLPTGNVASGNSVNIGSLSSNTQYYIWVRSKCGATDVSSWVGPLTFRTQCDPTTVPYEENFENVTPPAIPSCGMLENAGSGNNWDTFASTANGFNSNVLRYLFNGTNAANAWFYTQGISLTAGVSYRLKYKYGSNGATYIEKLKVAIGTSRVNTAMTQVLADHPSINNTTAAIESVVDFTPATTGIYYIGFNAYSAANQNRLFVDDISLDESPSCLEPSALSVSNLMADSATVQWTASTSNPASGYDYIISEDNTEPDDFSSPTDNVPTGTTLDLTSIFSNTTYYVWVRANCGSGETSEWVGPLTFTTPCTAFDAPFTESLDSGAIPSACWTNTSSNTVANGLWKFTGEAGYAVGNTRSAGTYAWVDGSDPSNISDVTLISPMINVSELTLPYLTFDMYSNNTGTYPNNIFKVDVQAVGGTWTNVYTNNTSSTQWRTIKITLPDYIGETIRVRFVVDKTAAPSGNAFYNDILLDNVNVNEAPTCLEVEGALTVANVTSEAADISWTASTSNPSGGYDYYVAEDNIAPNEFTTPTDNVAGTSVSLSSLFPNTTYRVWVRANCGAGDVSLWNSVPAVFTTKQVPATLPYSDDFEGGLNWTFVNGSQPNKWYIGPTVNNGGFNAIYISNTADGSNNQYTTGTNSVTFAYRDVELPTNIEEAKITFDWQAGGESTYDYIRVWAVPADFTPTPGTQLTTANSNGGVQLGTATIANGNFNLSTGFVTSDIIAPAAAYAGQTIRLVFEWRNDGGGGVQPAGAIDNVNITVVNCIAPTSPYVVATPGNTTIHWTEPNNVPSDGYDFYVAPDNTAPDAFTIPTGNVASGNSAVVPGLNEDSVYYYWIRSNCGNESSVWVSGGSLRTDCEIPYMPEYTNDFTDFAGAMPDAGSICWREANGVMQNNPINLTIGTSSWVSENYNNAAGDNGKAVRIELYGNKDQWIVSPAMELTAGTDYQLEYSASVIPWSGSTTVADMNEKFVKVVVSTDGGATWGPANVIKTYDNSNIPAGGVSEIVPLTGYTGVVKIGFYAHSASNTPDLRFYIDNFRVRETPACIEPTNLVAGTIGEDTAEISWDASLSAPADGYEYYASTDSTPPTVGTAGQGTVLAGVLNATVEDLFPSTEYFIWVRANCGSGLNSAWTGPVTVSTRCDAPEVSAVDGEKCGPGTVELSATSNDGGTLKWFAAQTGGLPLATGETFTTPEISETTTYYVMASGNESVTTGAARIDAPTTDGGTTPSNYGLLFDVTSEFTLNTVDVYLNSGTAGTLVVKLFNNAGAELQSADIALPAGGTTSAPVLHTIQLGWQIPAGTNYRIAAMSGPSMIRQYSASYPYPIGSAGTITSGYILGTSGSYYYFYNWSITEACTSLRIPVTATISDAPELTLSADPAAVCEGETTTAVTIATGASDYDTFVWSPSEGVSGDAANGWTFNPTVSTVYTLNASQSAGAMCDADPVTVNVTINPLPTAIVITNSAEGDVCINAVESLTVSGGEVPVAGQEVTIGDATTKTGLTEVLTAFNNRWSSLKSQTIYTAAELTAAGLSAGDITSIAYNITSLGSGTNVGAYTIKIGTTSNDTFTGTTYLDESSFTTVYGPVTYNHAIGWNTVQFTTPFEWDGVSNIVVAVRMTGANSTNNSETYYTETSGNTVLYNRSDLAATTGSTSNKRFNIKLIGTGLAPADVVWSPVAGLYSDEAATVPYAGENSSVVYVKSDAAASSTYTVTATSDAGCLVTETVEVNFVDCNIGWANLQFPATGTITTCEDLDVYAQVYKAGVTEDAGAGEAITAWIGVSDANTDPSTWDESDWQLATFNVQAGNNDEYTYSISGLDAGTYYYASRFQYLNGDYYYGGFSGGAWDGTTNVNGVLTVNAIAAPTASNQELCAGSTVADLEATGSNIAWYANATGGVALDGAAALVDGITYFASQTVDGCESIDRTPVLVDIITVTADNPADVSACNVYTLPALTAGSYYTEAGGNGTMLEAGDEITTTQTIYVYAASGTCSVDNSFIVTINVVADPVANAIQTINVDSADDATIEDIEITATGTVAWYASEEDANGGTGALDAGTQLISGNTYYAMQTVGNCTNDNPVPVTVTVVLGSKGFDMAAFSYHPNPVQNILNLTYSSDISSVSVYNLLGQEVMTQKVNATDVKVDMSSLADGAYLVKVAAGNAVKTVKVIKKQ